jgi:uncharacterized protein YcbK (DUF882 family)
MTKMLTKNFSVAETACKCGCNKCDMKPEFMAVLQHLRDIVGFPLHITSGYRCDKHNRAIGGASSSKHKEGIAVDIDTTSLTKDQRKTLIEAIKLIPAIKGVGIATSFIHIDTREFEAEWKY